MLEWYLYLHKLQGKFCEREVFPSSQKHIFSLNVILILQMLLVLAKEIYEWCLVAANKNGKLYIHIYGCRKYICGKVDRSQRHLEISNKMEMVPEYSSFFFFFFSIFDAILIFYYPS